MTFNVFITKKPKKKGHKDQQMGPSSGYFPTMIHKKKHMMSTFLVTIVADEREL